MNISQFPKRKQKGAASLVFVMLVSLVIFASSAKMFKELKNTQDIGTAMNAVSHAEPGTKLAAEAFRLFLETQSSNGIRTLPVTLPITTDPMGTINEFGVLSAEDISVIEPTADNFEVSATLVNKHLAARSSAKLQVVYAVASEAGPPPPLTLTPQLSFGTDLDINGNISLTDNGLPVEVFVDGDVDIGGVSLDPIEALHATGSVTIGSNVEIKSIFSNDDVTLANTKSNLVRTMGDVYTSGDAAVQLIQANGSVDIKSSGRFEEIVSRWDIKIDSGGAGQGILRAGRDVRVQNSGSIDSVTARVIAVYSGWFHVGSTVAGKIRCVSKNWTDYGYMSSNEKFYRCPNNLVNADKWQNVNIPIPRKISQLTINDPVIDVWTLKSEANYVVEYDAATKKIMVTVNNVNGLTDGTQYTVGDYESAPFKDYLCETVNGSGQCTKPSTPTLPLCFGYSLWNSCIEHDSDTNTFSFKPTTIAPGVVWFDGNVHLENGNTVSTILATGNISTRSPKQWSANRGGYDFICAGNASKAEGDVKSTYNNVYSYYYPRNLCDVATTRYIPTPTGNIAIAEGGINPDINVNPNNAFSGGNITLDSRAIVGAVLAGNVLQTKGQVSVQGLVSAASQLDDGSFNELDASTTIDFSSEADYDPFTMPNMNNGGTTAGASVPMTKVAAFLWSRPL